MRLKKGFTLAEILIVLMVIGAIATMTIPSLMKGVQEQQFKTAYKKAYNAVVNMAAMENVTGKLPSSNTNDDVIKFFDTMTTYLSIKEFASPATDFTVAQTVSDADYYVGVKYTTGEGDSVTNHSIGSTNSSDNALTFTSGSISPWVVTEDNMAYSVIAGGKSSCGNKASINATASSTNPLANSCVGVVVDVNGLAKGPNKMDSSVLTNFDSSKTSDGFADSDRFYIYIGSDGATAGNKTSTITGRVVADMR